ncbi:hypothetical protein [Larkinella knui]
MKAKRLLKVFLFPLQRASSAQIAVYRPSVDPVVVTTEPTG